MSEIDRDYGVNDLVSTQRAAGLSGAIVVQTANSPRETSELLAASDGRYVRGVIGWVNLEGDVAAQIGDLRRGPGCNLLVGVRHLARQDPDPHWLIRESLGDGLECLADAGLPFDLVVRANQLQDAVRLISAHPRVTFVLDHLGKPPIASGELHS